MFKKIKFLILSVLFFSTQMFSAPQEVISQNDIQESNKMADPKSIPTPDADDSVEDWSESVLERFNISEFGMQENGKIILFAEQAVSLKPLDPQYGDAVINGYEKAMMKIQEQFVMEKFGRIVVEKIRSKYVNQSTNAKNIKLPSYSNPSFWGKLKILTGKHLDLQEKKLDNELIAQGVNPESLQKMTPKIKKDLFRDKFLKKSIKTAFGTMSGLVPMQTTVIRDSTGKTVIGVVAVASDKTIQISKDIKLQRKSIIKGTGREVSSLLPKSAKEYLATLGVRLSYDVDGSPMIISYGISSYNPNSGDSYMNSELKSTAKENAITMADSQLAELINGYMSVKSSKESGEEISTQVEREVRFDSDTVEKQIKNIIKINQKTVKSNASARLQGLSTVKRWRYKTVDGIKFVGAVRVWKYSTLKSVKSFNKPKKKRNISKKKSTSNAFQESSPVVNSMDDF